MSQAEATRLGLATAPVAEQTLPTYRWLGARLAPIDARVVHVTSPVAGRVVSLDAKVGAHVRTGDLLARLASAEVAEAQGELLRAAAERDLAQKSLARQRALAALGATSLQEVEGARDRLLVARAETERARELVDLLGPGEVQAAGRVLRLTSPIDGEVMARHPSLGLTIGGALGGGGAGPELFTIADLSRVRVEIDLHARDVAHVAQGAKASVWPLAGLGAPAALVEGRIAWVGKTFDTHRHAATAHMEIDNDGGALHPYAPVRVRLEGTREVPVAVPRRAVAVLGGKTVVFTRDTTGPRAGEWVLMLRPVEAEMDGAGPCVAVRAGLHAGSVVVVGEEPSWPTQVWRLP